MTIPRIRRWFAGAWRAAIAECRRTKRDPRSWIAMLAVPLAWCAIVALAFGAGIMTKLPVGVVDLDGSSASREVLLTLDAIPSAQPVGFRTEAEAEAALRSAKTYATLVIPPGYEADQRSGRGAALFIAFNKTYYPVGTILELDLKTALARAAAEKAAVSLTQAGGTFDANAARLRATVPDAYFLGNPAFNFGAYLLPTIVPGVMALGAILCFASVLVREWRDGGVRLMLRLAGSPSAAVVGKLLPWLALYLIAATAWVAGFAGWAGWAPAGSLLLWLAAAWLLILAMAGVAAAFISIAPTWVIGLAACICLVAPTFPYTGFTYPLESMTPGAAFLGSLLPLTHFLHAQAACWVLGSPADAVARELLTLALYPAVGFAAALPLLSWRWRRWAREETESAELVRELEADPPARAPHAGFWRAAGKTLLHALWNRDTIAILGGAVAFYLVFYGWPYENQQLENLPTGVVDLDRSGASRRLIQAVDASSAANVLFIAHDMGEGLDALERGKTDALIVIPSGYAEAIAGGRNATLHLVGNGAFPVKARAVQAAVASIAMDPALSADEASTRTPGLPPAALAASLAKAPSALTEYRYNETSGYGTYIVPMVGPVIIQAVLVMGITMALGGWLGRTPRPGFIEDALERPACEGAACYAAFWLLAFLWFLYMEGFDFMLMEYGAMQNPAAAILSGACFCAAVAAMAVAIVMVLGSNRWTTPATVVMSAPSLFISGAVWPLENLKSPFVNAVAQFVPTTPGIRAIIAAAQDGAPTEAVYPACLHLIALALFYLALAWLASRRLKKRFDACGLAPAFPGANLLEE